MKYCNRALNACRQHGRTHGLLRLAVLRNAHVREHFLLEDLARVLDSLLLRDARLRTTSADEAQGHLLLLDDERLVDGRLDHFDHLHVRLIVDDVLHDVQIGHESECAKHDHDGDFLQYEEIKKKAVDLLTCLMYGRIAMIRWPIEEIVPAFPLRAIMFTHSVEAGRLQRP